MKFQNLSVKRLFGRVARSFVLSMSGITIALFFLGDKTDCGAADTGAAAVRHCRIFVLTQAFWKATVAVYH